jgi:hypothetical protein
LLALVCPLTAPRHREYRNAVRWWDSYANVLLILRYLFQPGSNLPARKKEEEKKEKKKKWKSKAARRQIAKQETGQQHTAAFCCICPRLRMEFIVSTCRLACARWFSTPGVSEF